MRNPIVTIVFGLACCLIVVSAVRHREQTVPTISVSTETGAESNGPDSASDEDGASRDENADSAQPPDREAPSLDIAALHQAGLQALQAGETDAAYAYARQAMRLEDEDPQVIFLMAMVLAERRRFPEAIRMLEEVAETTPQARLPAMGQTADWLVRYGKWDEAEARYLEILKQVPDSVLVHRNLAKLLLRQGRRVEAVSHLDHLCHLGDVTERELRSMLVIVHPMVGDAEDKQSDPIGLLGMARTEIARSDWHAVQNRLEQADSLGPWESALLGRVYAELGELDSLQRWIIAADDSVNISPDAWYAKGVHAASVGQTADATRCFIEAVLQDPTDRDAYAHLAQSLTASHATRQADAVKQRVELLEETRTIGMRMAASADRDQQSILRLSDLLRQLQRPLEAVGWRGVWLSYANSSRSVSESEIQQVLDEIVQEREMLLKKGTARASTDFVLCGVKVDALPSRREVDQRLKSSSR